MLQYFILFCSILTKLLDNIKMKTSLFTQRLHVKQCSSASEYYLSILLQHMVSVISAVSNTVIGKQETLSWPCTSSRFIIIQGHKCRCGAKHVCLSPPWHKNNSTCCCIMMNECFKFKLTQFVFSQLICIFYPKKELANIAKCCIRL